MSAIVSAATKVAISGGVVALILFRMSRAKNRDLGWFGIVRPELLPTAIFAVVYLGWMLASDQAIHWRGPWDFRPWQSAPLLASAMRVLAVCLLGPMAEELLFRGVIFSWLKERIPLTLTIVLTAVGWALLHWSYSWAVIGVIVIDGILLGAARARTGSVVPPIIMHALYNLYAIW
ncbi:MAG TPA: CPBP family intramembrane glutamic endopeptidase [Sphingomicrobium sp.]|nr:CPBP family intramembrane glutamic endopeptidase [Sphingomicrobium sp.]